MGAKTRRGAPSAGTECVAVDAMALRHSADAPHRVASYSPCQTAQFLRSRLVSRPGSLLLPFLTFVAADPRARGLAERRETSQPCTCRASDARRHACEAWALPRKPGGPPHGAPPWRCRPRTAFPPGS